MKVLILSCNTGGGHNSAAKAIKEAFDERGHYCCVMDALSFGQTFHEETQNRFRYR